MLFFINFLYWLLLPILGLIIEGGLILKFAFKKPPSFVFLKKLYHFLIIFLIFYGFSLSFLNYYLWLKGELTQKFLPPYNSIFYVIRYSFFYFFFKFLLSIFFSLLIFYGISFFNKKFQERLFYEEEKYLAGISFLVIGWPTLIFYLFFVLFLGLVFQIISFFVFKKLKRISFLYFWPSIALLVLIFNGIILKISFLNVLNIY